eukprot:6212316-Pleurochrysis_carterae.AAC.4
MNSFDKTAPQPGAGQVGEAACDGRPGAPAYNSNGFRCAKQVSMSRLRRVAALHFATSNQSALGSQQYRQHP